MKDWLKHVGGVVLELAWRGFGVLLFIVGTSAGVGAMATGDPFMGVLIAWWTIMLGIVGAVGYAIATTGRASKETVAGASRDAVEKAKADADKK